ncbi:MAG: YebC/PmpR family DNA-binding transcriptional regulator [Planctomycetota bacterium]|nr:YebC/PmpR family DNA-binding transcriptional regulator [Planctomycetota bacterium]MDA1106528.1 YebC/PmpR family DNA-binding transcriptional regulator [Planctomycetota bacterium]
MAGHSAWKNIKHRKAAVDAKRGKIWSKCSRAIIVAAKSGGDDPKFNAGLRLAIDEAKAANMPRDTIEKAVKKGAGGADGEHFEAIRYEGYAAGGVAIIAECLTSNVNRTAPEIRMAFDKNGGNLGVPGSVSFSFQQCGLILVAASPEATEERVMELALEAGADDVQLEEDGFEVQTPATALAAVRDALEGAGLQLESSGIAWVPQTMVHVDSSVASSVARLVDALEDHDDIQRVWHNASLAEGVS